VLFFLFAIQMVFPETRLMLSAVYGVLSVVNVARLGLQWRSARQAAARPGG
jgi:hypothetical protein